MKPRCSIHSSRFIFPWFLSFGVSIKESFGSFANNSSRKINLSRFDFSVKNNFFGKWFQQIRFKRNKIGSWHIPSKHERSHSTVKIANRKAISSGLYKTRRDSIHFNKHRKSLENTFLRYCEGSFNNCTVCNLIFIPWNSPKLSHRLIFFKRWSKRRF